MTEGNGIYKFVEKRFNDVDKELLDLKDDLAHAIRELSGSIEKQSDSTTKLTETVGTLATQFASFLHIAANAIPLKAVGWMFAIILVFVVLLLAGIEGVREMAKFWRIAL